MKFSYRRHDSPSDFRESLMTVFRVIKIVKRDRLTVYHGYLLQSARTSNAEGEPCQSL